VPHDIGELRPKELMGRGGPGDDAVSEDIVCRAEDVGMPTITGVVGGRAPSVSSRP